MSVITTEKLERHRRRAGRRASTASGCSHDDALPAVVPRGARGQRRARVPRPPPRRRGPGRVQPQARQGREASGKGEHPEIFRVTLDPAKNSAAQYLRGTFDWHIDGCTDDIPIMATMLSAHAVAESGRRDRVRQHLRRLRRRSTTTRRRTLESLRVVHTIEASQRLHNPDPTAEEVEIGAAARRRSTRSCGRTGRAASRSCSAPPPTTSRAWTTTRAGRCSHDLLDRATTARPRVPPRVGAGRRRDLGQPRRAAPGLPLRPDLAPRHAPHDLRRRRAHPVSDERSRASSPAALRHRPRHRRAPGRRRARRRRLRPRRRRGRRGGRQDRRAGGTADGRHRRRDRARPDRRRGGAGREPRSGAPTVLVNNAGVEGFDPFLKITLEKWNRAARR